METRFIKLIGLFIDRAELIQTAETMKGEHLYIWLSYSNTNAL